VIEFAELPVAFEGPLVYVELDAVPSSSPPLLPALVRDPLPPGPAAWRTDAPPDRLCGMLWVQSETATMRVEPEGVVVRGWLGCVAPMHGRPWDGTPWQPAVSRSGAYPTAAELDLSNDILRAMSGQPVDEE
jgi:hypothetical protein